MMHFKKKSGWGLWGEEREDWEGHRESQGHEQAGALCLLALGPQNAQQESGKEEGRQEGTTARRQVKGLKEGEKGAEVTIVT